MKITARISLIGLLASNLVACTAVYTEADVEAEEGRMDASAKAEEAIDPKLGEQLGGENMKEMEEEDDYVERQSSGL
jgi:hypothetical protein